jgi:hypothetical protein
MIKPARMSRLLAAMLSAGAVVSLAGCGGGGDSDDTGLVGSWRVAEIGTGGATTSCPAEIQLGNGISASCGNDDILVLRKNGQFHFVTGDPDGGEPYAFDGTWETTANDQTLTFRLEESRRDLNADGRIDPNEIFTIDPVVILPATVSRINDSRIALDGGLPSSLQGQGSGYRSILTRLQGE